MKGGLVSMLYGALAARELGLLGDRRIVLHFGATRRPAAWRARVTCARPG